MASDINSIVSVSITTTSVRVARASFGIPLIAAYHTHWPERVHTYSASTALTTMVSEGFSTSDSAYLAMQALLSQNPRPKTVKIGRRDNSWTQITRITPTAANNTEYAVDINGTTISYTSDGSATVAEITAGLTTAINGSAVASAVTAADNTTHVTVTSDTATKVFSLQYVEGKEQNYTILDKTADSSPDDDLDLIRAADSTFYGLVLDSPGSIDIATTAAWAETQRVLYHANSADTDMMTSSTSDLGHALKAANYARTLLMYHPDQTSYAGAAWVGRMLPFDPGSATWAFKTLAGVSVYDITSTQEGYLTDKNVNTYLEVAGDDIARAGVASSGFFADETIGIDWLTARIQESVFGLIASRPKLPYTDESVDLIRGQILARLQDAVSKGVLRALDDDGNPPRVEAPLVADVDPLDRANRLLPDVFFSGVLAGAVHSIEISGSLSI